MVIGLCVMITKRVSVERVISSSMSQKRSTLWSSSGASTSSSTQIGAGLVRNTAKISAKAVSACSPPDKSDSVAGFLPGGLAMISRPASSGSSLSISCNSAVPIEQLGEQLLEMFVDLLERGQQPLARLAVEALDA